MPSYFVCTFVYVLRHSGVWCKKKWGHCDLDYKVK